MDNIAFDVAFFHRPSASSFTKEDDSAVWAVCLSFSAFPSQEHRSCGAALKLPWARYDCTGGRKATRLPASN
jgi:hypothetical protein